MEHISGTCAIALRHVVINVQWTKPSKFVCGTIIVILVSMFLQVSALEQDIIEVDPETKEMLKALVSFPLSNPLLYTCCWLFDLYYTQDFGNISNLQVTAPPVQSGSGGYGSRR